MIPPYMILPTVLFVSLLALVLTKIADIITTMRVIRRCGSVAWERNPLARRAMERWRPAGGIGFVMLFWIIVVGVCYGTAFLASGWIQTATALAGFFIARAQWDVARMNATGRHSRFTSAMLRLYQRSRP